MTKNAANTGDKYISIAKDYTLTPGGRWRSQGDFSAEEFFEEHLLPLFNKAVEEGVAVVVDLDGTYGYGSSFLEETFGGLVRKFGYKNTLKHIKIISNDEPYLEDDIYKKYMVRAK